MTSGLTWYKGEPSNANITLPSADLEGDCRAHGDVDHCVHQGWAARSWMEERVLERHRVRVLQEISCRGLPLPSLSHGSISGFVTSLYFYFRFYYLASLLQQLPVIFYFPNTVFVWWTIERLNFKQKLTLRYFRTHKFCAHFNVVGQFSPTNYLIIYFLWKTYL